jgi:hypothetical protein
MATDLPTRPDLSPEVLALKRQVARLLGCSVKTIVAPRTSIANFAREITFRGVFLQAEKGRQGAQNHARRWTADRFPDAERDWRCERRRSRAPQCLKSEGDGWPFHEGAAEAGPLAPHCVLHDPGGGPLSGLSTNVRRWISNQDLVAHHFAPQCGLQIAIWQLL